MIIFGDFNVAPFETPLLLDETLCALPSYLKAEARSKRRGKKALYNPSWYLLSDVRPTIIENDGMKELKYSPKPIGTFRYNISKHEPHDHHLLDQVIISADLQKNFDYSEFRIVEINNDNPSDHLPIFFKLILP